MQISAPAAPGLCAFLDTQAHIVGCAGIATAVVNRSGLVQAERVLWGPTGKGALALD